MATKATLMVNPATGAISAPVVAVTFRTSNNIQVASADLDTFILVASWAGANLTLSGSITSTSTIHANSDITSGAAITSTDDITAGGQFVGDGGGITGVPAASVTGTLGYLHGGTNATTQTGLVINSAGAKIFANGAALQAGSADYAGQFCTTADGISFSVARSTTAGDTDNDVVCLNAQVYFSTILPSAIQSGKLNANASGVGAFNVLQCSGVTYIDNAVDLFNSSGGYSAWAAWDPSDAVHLGRALAGGIGPTASPSYAHKGYIATNPIQSSPTGAPPDLGIYQERADVAIYTAHRRIYFDGTNKSITSYGWTNDTETGPVGWFVDASGNVGIRTSTLTSGAELTVGGEICAGNGAVGTPAYAFSNDADCGLYRIGTNNLGMSIGGVKLVDYAAADLKVTGQLTTTGGSAGMLVNARDGGVGFQFYAGTNGLLNLYDNAATVVVFQFSGYNFFVGSNEAGDLGGASNRWRNLYLGKTITAGATTGNQTINKASGSVNFAAAATTLTVTNGLVTTSSIILGTIATNDGTATLKNIVAGAGSFVITLTAAATAETRVNFLVTN